ncbi:hypothetical protein [Membranihabitans maritimus]|uniref:hypothetical protein n=1 Tax=Membranihabitans maritimus TaxID=2904244 RepID=UPI001F3A9361|nr:hypothetical protein [Membranihabitans maritimus]
MNAAITQPISMKPLFSVFGSDSGSGQIGSEIHDDPVYAYPTFAIQNKILECKELCDNWDGQGAQPPSESTISNALNFIDLLPDSTVAFLDEENIVCTPYGTIVLDFENQDDVFSVEIGNRRLGYFFESAGKIILKVNQEPVNRYKLSNNVVQGFKQLQK